MTRAGLIEYSVGEVKKRMKPNTTTKGMANNK